MLRLETVTAADFAPHVGSDFMLRGADGAVPLTLTEAAGRGRGSTEGRPFGLLFAGPPAPALPQQIYALMHEAMGEMELFLVPIGGDGSGRIYEAIFT